MTITDNGVDYVSAPKDYADLFRTYHSYVLSLVRRLGLDREQTEDIASDILLRFYERDFLHKFDPTLVFEYQGEKRPARFKSFLTKFVLIYMRGMSEKKRRIASRELLVVDGPTETDNCWLDEIGRTEASPESAVLEEVAADQLVADLRAHLATVPRRSLHDRCDLVALFDAVVEQVRREGRWNGVDLQWEFGISQTALHSWLWWLRENLAAAMNRPVPPKLHCGVKTAA